MKTAPAGKPRRPPGPPRTSPLRALFTSPARRLARLQKLARQYGDIVSLGMPGEEVVFVNHPDLIREVLVTQSRNFAKGRGLEVIKPFLGEGLLTSEGERHRRQRRMMQPAFHHRRIAAFAEAMTAHAEGTTANWRDGQRLQISEEMMQLTLAIVSQTLFGSELAADAKEVGPALTAMMKSFPLMMLPFAEVLQKLPLPRLRRMRVAHARLDEIIYGLIDQRRARSEEGDDLLSMLIQAQDEEDPTRTMSDRQVRDEAMTIFLAGHETTANAMNWIWYLLSQNPEAEAKLHAELDAVLAGRRPTLADLSRLVYTEQVVSESLRLYPPAWLIGRRAIAACQLGGYEIPPRTIVLMSQFILHRDTRYFSDPLRFAPERWTAERKAALPKFAFFPFGGGPRQCIGEGFAWMEASLLLATIARKWRLELVPGFPVAPQPLVTLRLKHGLQMTARLRRPAG